MGIVGSCLYNTSLSVYYVSVIKFGVKDKDFKRKIEFWCHFIPNAFAICSSIFLQVGGYFNSMGGESFVTSFKNFNDEHLSSHFTDNTAVLTFLACIKMLRAGYPLHQSSVSLILTSNVLVVERKPWYTENGWG